MADSLRRANCESCLVEVRQDVPRRTGHVTDQGDTVPRVNEGGQRQSASKELMPGASAACTLADMKQGKRDRKSPPPLRIGGTCRSTMHGNHGAQHSECRVSFCCACCGGSLWCRPRTKFGEKKKKPKNQGGPRRMTHCPETDTRYGRNFPPPQAEKLGKKQEIQFTVKSSLDKPLRLPGRLT